MQQTADYGGVNATTTYQYDDNMNLVRFTDANGNATSFTYTSRNELEQETYADGTTVAYTYDNRGNIDTRTDQAGETITHIYDSLSRVTGITFSTGGSQSFAYDKAGRTTYAAETANGHTSILTYGYNAMGDVFTSTQQLDGVGGTAWQVDYNYDYASGTYTVTYPSGVDAVYTSDPIGRLDLVQQDNGSLSTVADYAYDNLNSFYTIAFGNGTVNRFDYDALYRTTQVKLTSGTTTLANYGYGYDGANNRTYMQRNHLTNSPADVYDYDNLYQLTQVWYGADSTTPANITSYDDHQGYTLDTLGNRLAVAFNDGSSTTTQPYGPNNGSQLTNSMNRYETVAGQSLSYDLNGNTLTDGVTDNSYGYDQLNRQISVTDGSTNAEYIYDAMGRRIAKVVDGVTTYYLYDKQFRVIEERTDETTWSARYTYGAGIDEPLLMERSGSSYTYHRDALGSVTELSDANGNLVERYEYDVYGEPEFYDGSYNAITESAIGNPYLFTGRRYDPESSNYYYRARIYSPTLGRFLSMDPMGYKAGDANLYRYTFNNPIKYVDPHGLLIPEMGELLRTAIIWRIQRDLDFLHWWSEKPDDCSCGRNKDTSFYEGGVELSQNLQQLGLSFATTIGEKSGTLSVYQRLSGDWIRSLSTSIQIQSKGVVGNPSLIIKWAGSDMAMEVTNVQSSAVGGFGGLPGAVLFGGLIDGAAQILKDLFSMKCLSPEQIALRSLIAVLFGLIAASIGAFASAIAIYLGASTLATVFAGFIVSSVVAGLLASKRNLWLDFIEVAY